MLQLQCSRSGKVRFWILAHSHLVKIPSGDRSRFWRDCPRGGILWACAPRIAWVGVLQCAGGWSRASWQWSAPRGRCDGARETDETGVASPLPLLDCSGVLWIGCHLSMTWEHVTTSGASLLLGVGRSVPRSWPSAGPSFEWRCRIRLWRCARQRTSCISCSSMDPGGEPATTVQPHIQGLPAAMCRNSLKFLHSAVGEGATPAHGAFEAHTHPHPPTYIFTHISPPPHHTHPPSHPPTHPSNARKLTH